MGSLTLIYEFFDLSGGFLFSVLCVGESGDDADTEVVSDPYLSVGIFAKPGKSNCLSLCNVTDVSDLVGRALTFYGATNIVNSIT